MGKVIRGTRDAKGVTTLVRAEGGYDKIRCPTCKALAVRVQNGRGSALLRCTGACGSTFKVSTL